jgi:hypothetical protein
MSYVDLTRSPITTKSTRQLSVVAFERSRAAESMAREIDHVNHHSLHQACPALFAWARCAAVRRDEAQRRALDRHVAEIATKKSRLVPARYIHGK